jgi:hypothetical protein
MATTTPNFGWPVPTSTDLVKNGATAIEALGDSIDASMLDLKGGTTGQVLSKTTNTDMDFTWVTTDDANAIQNSIVNAKGDLIGASANDVPAILSVGSNGETLVADSSTSTGLRYTAGTVQANPFINSAFQVWQRGTSISNFGFFSLYTADRWNFVSTNTGRTISQQLTSDTTNLPFIQYCGRFQRDSGNTDTTYYQTSQSMESINSIPFAGKTVTFSFYGRRGANYSPTSNILTVSLKSGTGTDQAVGGYTGNVNIFDSTATLTTTWQRFTYTGTVPTNSTELGVIFRADPTGTAGAADFFEITGVQLDIGSVALPFRTYAGTIQGELAACQRYYIRYGGSATYSALGFGSGVSSTAANIKCFFPVEMRVNPTSVDYATLTLADTASLTAVTSLSLDTNSLEKKVGVIAVNTASGLTQYRPYTLLTNNSTSGYVGFSAEL